MSFYEDQHIDATEEYIRDWEERNCEQRVNRCSVCGTPTKGNMCSDCRREYEIDCGIERDLAPE